MTYDLSVLCDRTLESVSTGGVRPKMLLHACCAPCSSYVTEYLEPFFDLTLYFFNPNISPYDEFRMRYDELVRFIREKYGDRIGIICPEWKQSAFLSAVSDCYQMPEGSERCLRCYSLRLEATAKAASDGGFPYFCTTLSVSPYKNARALYEIGSSIGNKYGVLYLPSDFKKKGGYKRSIDLSREYGLYRQNYCGCLFSKKEAAERRKDKASD